MGVCNILMLQAYRRVLHISHILKDTITFNSECWNLSSTEIAIQFS
jgi:hypothetical protein